MQKNTTQDLRTIRTHKLIRTAFQNLLEKMDYRDITIKELSEQAGINRKTFYSHYDSIDELLAEMQRELLDDVYATLRHDTPRDFKDTLVALYRMLCNQSEWYHKLLCTGNNSMFTTQITNQLLEKTISWFHNPGDVQQIKAVLKINFISASFAELYRSWHTMGSNMPTEEFIHYATGLICNGLSEDS